MRRLAERIDGEWVWLWDGQALDGVGVSARLRQINQRPTKLEMQRAIKAWQGELGNWWDTDRYPWERRLQMSIAIEKHEPQAGLGNEIMMFYGGPKIGKTSLAAQFPKSLIVDLEKGAGFIKCTRVMPDSIAELRQVYEMLKSNSGAAFETIVLDSVDKLNDLIEKDVCRDLKIKDISDAEWGGGWSEARNRLLDLVVAFKSLGKLIIIIGHRRRDLIPGVDKMEIGLDLPGKLGRYLLAQCDSLAYFYAEKLPDSTVGRFITFSPVGGLECGSRNPALAGKVIRLLPGQGWQAIMKCFESEASPKTKREPVTT